jgi:hypothetical protein
MSSGDRAILAEAGEVIIVEAYWGPPSSESLLRRRSTQAGARKYGVKRQGRSEFMIRHAHPADLSSHLTLDDDTKAAPPGVRGSGTMNT